MAERIIEAALFLTPFLAFAAWRLLFASILPPATLVVSTGCVALALLGSLLWLHHIDAGNAGRRYVPAALVDGKLIPGHAAPQ